MPAVAGGGEGAGEDGNRGFRKSACHPRGRVDTRPTKQSGGPSPPDSVMDETPTPENSEKKGFNPIDLSQLQGFSFGTQWSQEKAEPGARSGSREDAPRRDGGPGRDRRGFRRPQGFAGDAGEGGGPGQSPDSRGPREPRPYGSGENRGGPRREGFGGPREGFGGPRGGDRGPGAGPGERRPGGPRFGGPREEFVRPEDRGPYVSPHFAVTFYPEDVSFSALAKTIRSSCRTFELFDIAKTVIGKPERFVVVLTRKAPETETASAPGTKLAPVSVSVPDGLPFDSDEAAIAHVLDKHLGLFFDVAEVEIDPPKGNFQVINKCGITGELLGPPNYHRYNQILQQHHAARIKGLSFEAFRGRVESVRDPEAVAQWQAKMRKATRYTWKQGSAAVAAPAAVTAEGEAAPPSPAFDSFEEARLHLLTHAREKLVRGSDSVRFHGTVIATLPAGEVRRAVEGALERQRRFPLDTANALRGRLRRENFTIFKKGSKGVSYVCAVKRKFRVPGQTFSESIGAVIAYIEAHPMVRASELPAKVLGIRLPAAPAAGAPAGEAAPALAPEQQTRLARMQGDLRWLVTEGYVTEFLDGRLFAPPAMVDARKKEIESAEHDPENFPEAPPAEAAPAAAPASAPVAEARAAGSNVAEPAGTAAVEGTAEAGLADAVPAPIAEASVSIPADAAPAAVETAPEVTASADAAVAQAPTDREPGAPPPPAP